jgi:hypothetical protein
VLDCFDEFAAEHLTENAYRKEELVFAWMHPVVVVLGQSTGGDNAVNMRVVASALTIP